MAAPHRHNAKITNRQGTVKLGLSANTVPIPVITAPTFCARSFCTSLRASVPVIYSDSPDCIAVRPSKHMRF